MNYMLERVTIPSSPARRWRWHAMSDDWHSTIGQTARHSRTRAGAIRNIRRHARNRRGTGGIVTVRMPA